MTNHLLIDWLTVTDWLSDWLTDWHWLTGWQWLTDWLTVTDLTDWLKMFLYTCRKLRIRSTVFAATLPSTISIKSTWMLSWPTCSTTLLRHGISHSGWVTHAFTHSLTIKSMYQFWNTNDFTTIKMIWAWNVTDRRIRVHSRFIRLIQGTHTWVMLLYTWWVLMIVRTNLNRKIKVISD